MLTLIVFIIILSFLVLIHEFGHFVAAKKSGVRVEEFGLGLPPKLFGKKYGETEYTFNLLPFGGFVKLTGEDELLDEGQVEPDPRNFMSKTPFQRVVILIAGVTMNFLLAVFLYYIFFFFTDFKTANLPLIFDYNFRFGNEVTHSAVITGFSDGSPLVDKETTVGDAILAVNGVAVEDITDVREALEEKADQAVTLTLLDLKKFDSRPYTTEVIPVKDEDGKGMLGVYIGKSVQIRYETPVQKLFAGFFQAYNMTSYSVNAMGSLISTSYKERDIEPVSQSVSGPVGIYNIVGSILNYGGQGVWLSLIDFVALMSLSLAFLNLLPFPALDGGRLVFVLYELVTKRRVKPSIEAVIHKVGITVLLGLIVLITVKDISNIFFN